ncbi:unnamed protein product [Chondrus crispus]|uniref:Uncharacterized protein n=1 Tax=Chondrus crispus TaxID=2769 RepID=R7QCK4_CHOCR|nr:unnamed protein product [Chondrus crispus]CDF35809.1 unnamed protein product [Chondrus crispus]|eukprot:XP_005715628.1 unnamed protein product [Chondrus crispus]
MNSNTTAPTNVPLRTSKRGQSLTITDWVIRLMNLSIFLFQPRKGSNFRWANTVRDSISFLGEFAEGQHTKIYGRVTSRYKYHLQQQYENAIRKFDATDPLAAHLQQVGNAAFYQSLPGHVGQIHTNFAADLTRISDIASIGSSADYLFVQVSNRKSKEEAEAARDSYVRGFSRPVRADDFDDWERLRDELRSHQRVGEVPDGRPEDFSCLIAVSYKSKDVKITRRMLLLKEDGSPDKEEGILNQIQIQMTDDFFDDFRWSQLVRSCIAIARRDGKSHVRLWVDRLVMMGIEKEQREAIFKLTKWEEFGLLPYAVCHVVRLYESNEPYYGTDFWRKLETVLGVAGKGLFVDDYMLRKYDHTIYFGPKIYQRLGDGLCCIGGGGVYIRSTTLALATAVLTDGVSVRAAHEDRRTKRSATGWKSWAIRTITEGAYSSCHSSIMVEEEPSSIGYQQFLIITFWESMVSRSISLTGRSYLDMSYQRSMEWKKSSSWDGIVEWIGMMPESCIIGDRNQIMNFLNQQSDVDLYVSTTGHVASIITLQNDDLRDKRTLVVDLARFSTARSGHVTAVAEATGIWENSSVIPFYLKHVSDPDGDQLAEVQDDRIVFLYKQMKVEFFFMKALKMICVVVGNLILIWFTFGGWLIFAAVQLGLIFRPWPWVDTCDVGEAVFDNLLLHALYDAGIKKQYRRLRNVPFNQIGWR